VRCHHDIAQRLASTTYALHWHRLYRHLAQRLRIEPGITSIAAVDLLDATATLDNKQRYTITPVTATGELAVDAEWSDAVRARVRRYCRRRLPDSATQDYWAGAVVSRQGQARALDSHVDAAAEGNAQTGGHQRGRRRTVEISAT
jgi:hypothetical protein